MSVRRCCYELLYFCRMMDKNAIVFSKTRNVEELAVAHKVQTGLCQPFELRVYRAVIFFLSCLPSTTKASMARIPSSHPQLNKAVIMLFIPLLYQEYRCTFTPILLLSFPPNSQLGRNVVRSKTHAQIARRPAKNATMLGLVSAA